MSYDMLVCPVCDTREFDPIGPPQRVVAQDGDLWTPPPAARCRECGLAVETHVAYPPGAYTREAYDGARDHGAGADRWGRFHHDSAVAAARFDQLQSYLGRMADGPKRPLWVDLGCGNGAFLAAARRRGWAVMGVEADPFVVRELAARLGLPAVTFDMWAAGAARADGVRPRVVSGFDFVEHMLDPVDAVVTAFGALESGGLLVFEVPDLDRAEDFGTWRHRRVGREFTEHVTHWGAKAFRRLADRYLPGAEVQRTAEPVPGKLQVVIRKRG